MLTELANTYRWSCQISYLMKTAHKTTLTEWLGNFVWFFFFKSRISYSPVSLNSLSLSSQETPDPPASNSKVLRLNVCPPQTTPKETVIMVLGLSYSSPKFTLHYTLHQLRSMLFSLLFQRRSPMLHKCSFVLFFIIWVCAYRYTEILEGYIHYI